MSTNEESVSMARRALLTEHERDALLDRESNDARYVAVSRVRKKIDEELTRDVEVLRHHDEEHDTDLLGKLRDAVCENVEEEDIAMSGSSEGAFDDFEPVDVGETDAVEADREFGTEGVDSDAVKAAITDIEFPSTKDREECLEAIRAAYEYLQDHGKATMSEFVREVMPEHPVGYDVESDIERINDPDKRNRSTWWRKVVKPGLQALPDVESPPKGASNWTYTGDRDE